MSNQIPSKLFEYFGTGKPILHLSPREDDAVLPYLKRYPLALVLSEQEGVTPDVLARLNIWLREMRGQALTYDKAAELFPEFTPAAVAQRFIEIITR